MAIDCEALRVQVEAASGTYNDPKVALAKLAELVRVYLKWKDEVFKGNNAAIGTYEDAAKNLRRAVGVD